MMTQRMAALERANEIRTARAAMKRELFSGDLTFSAALKDPRAAGMDLYDLLLARPRWGRKRARQLLVMIGVSPWKQVGTLTERQLRLLGDIESMTQLPDRRIAA